MEKSLLWGDEIRFGKFFERTDVPTLTGAEASVERRPAGPSDPNVPPNVARSFIES